VLHPHRKRYPSLRQVARLLMKAVAVAAALLAGSQASAADGADRPNFVIVYTDDQGYRDVGCYGAKGFTTPNLDRLAREGPRGTAATSTAHCPTPPTCGRGTPRRSSHPCP